MARTPRLPSKPSARNTEIYEKHKSGMTYKELGVLYQISAARVGQIIHEVISINLTLDIYGYLEVDMPIDKIKACILRDYGPKFEFLIEPAIRRNLQCLLANKLIQKSDPRLKLYAIRIP